MKQATITIFALALMTAGLPSQAHEHATGVVKERMDAMTSMAKHHKTIGERIKAKRDLAGVKADAEAIAALASHIAHLFPAGSTQPPTQARAAIWQNWADFESKATALATASKKLVAISPADAPAFAAASSAVTRASEKYRARRR
jgi:cytochrome c556